MSLEVCDLACEIRSGICPSLVVAVVVMAMAAAVEEEEGSNGSIIGCIADRDGTVLSQLTSHRQLDMTSALLFSQSSSSASFSSSLSCCSDVSHVTADVCAFCPR